MVVASRRRAVSGVSTFTIQNSSEAEGNFLGYRFNWQTAMICLCQFPSVSFTIPSSGAGSRFCLLFEKPTQSWNLNFTFCFRKIYSSPIFRPCNLYFFHIFCFKPILRTSEHSFCENRCGSHDVVAMQVLATALCGRTWCDLF